MNPSPPDDDFLAEGNRDPDAQAHELIARLLAGQATPQERARLNQILADDRQVLEQLTAQLEVESLLRWHHGDHRRPGELVSPRRQTDRRPLRPAWVAAAALLTVACGALWWLLAGPNGGPVPRPQGPTLTLAANWRIEANPDSRFEIIEPYRIRLDKGEILLVATPTDEDEPQPLRVDTPTGRAETRDAEFYVGTHEVKEQEKMSVITRVLVLAGTVTLSNTLGSTSGAASDLLTGPQDSKPVNQSVRANSEFALSLYDRLRKQNSGENLFFSPYSMSAALLMAMEGARGENGSRNGLRPAFSARGAPHGGRRPADPLAHRADSRGNGPVAAAV